MGKPITCGAKRHCTTLIQVPNQSLSSVRAEPKRIVHFPFPFSPQVSWFNYVFLTFHLMDSDIIFYPYLKLSYCICILFLATINPIWKDTENNHNWTNKQLEVEEMKWSWFGGWGILGKEPSRSSKSSQQRFLPQLWAPLLCSLRDRGRNEITSFINKKCKKLILGYDIADDTDCFFSG